MREGSVLSSRFLYLCVSMAVKTILYIHGMGGGADSRIPSILRDAFESKDIAQVICRTYDFDPEIGHEQIEAWIKEVKPDLVIGESLGSLHALRIRNIPLMFVSPALNTAFYFTLLSWLIWIPGLTRYFENKYRPKEGDRQPLRFVYDILKKYKKHGREALCSLNRNGQYIHAYFGTRDHYRKSAVVSVRRWKKLFGDSFTMYDGTHFMENEMVESIMIPDICSLLKINK